MRLTNTNDPHELVVLVSPADDEEGGGRFKFLQCAPTVSHALLVRFKDDEGRDDISVHPKYQRLGWRLLRDLYAEERNPKGYAEFEAWYKANVGKRAPAKFPDDKLPQEVRRRRVRIVETPTPAPAEREGESAGEPAKRGKAGG